MIQLLRIKEKALLLKKIENNMEEISPKNINDYNKHKYVSAAIKRCTITKVKHDTKILKLKR